MKHLSILLATFAVAFSGCQNEPSVSPFANERIRQIIVKENGSPTATYDFQYNPDKTLAYYIQNGTDTFFALGPDALFTAENIGGGYTDIPLFQTSNGLVTRKNGSRWIGAGFDYYYYRKDTGSIAYNSDRQMTFYENFRSTDSTGCEPEREYFNLAYSGGDYTRVTGYNGYTACFSSNHDWIFPDLHFTYSDQPSSLGWENFGISMLGASGIHAADSIYGSIEVDSDGFIFSDSTYTIAYKVNNVRDDQGRIIKTNFLPYNFTLANMLLCYHWIYFPISSGPGYLFGADPTFEITYW